TRLPLHSHDHRGQRSALGVRQHEFSAVLRAGRARHRESHPRPLLRRGQATRRGRERRRHGVPDPQRHRHRRAVDAIRSPASLLRRHQHPAALSRRAAARDGEALSREGTRLHHGSSGTSDRRDLGIVTVRRVRTGAAAAFPPLARLPPRLIGDLRRGHRRHHPFRRLAGGQDRPEDRRPHLRPADPHTPPPPPPPQRGAHNTPPCRTTPPPRYTPPPQTVRRLKKPPPPKPMVAPKRMPKEPPPEARPEEDKGIAVQGEGDKQDPAGLEGGTTEGGVVGGVAGAPIELPDDAIPPRPKSSNVIPPYPQEARADGRTGVVVLEIVILADGSVDRVKVVRGDEPFASAAVDAVKTWKYEPARFKGQPISVFKTFSVTFKLA